MNRFWAIEKKSAIQKRLFFEKSRICRSRHFTFAGFINEQDHAGSIFAHFIPTPHGLQFNAKMDFLLLDYLYWIAE